MNATASITATPTPTPTPRRAVRFGLASLLLLGLLLAAGWVLFNGVMQWADVHHAIEIDGDTIHLGEGDPLQWLVAGLGLVIAAVVVLLVVPVVVVLALAVPLLVLLMLLAVPLLLAALVLSPVLLMLWLLWKLIA
jgi:hypothetical protein